MEWSDALVDRARSSNAVSGGYTNVEFYLAMIDKIPLPDAYAKVENQAGCCSPAMGDATACCSPTAGAEPTVHEEVTELLAKYDVNAAVASEGLCDQAQRRTGQILLRSELLLLTHFNRAAISKRLHHAAL